MIVLKIMSVDKLKLSYQWQETNLSFPKMVGHSFAVASPC